MLAHAGSSAHCRHDVHRAVRFASDRESFVASLVQAIRGAPIASDDAHALQIGLLCVPADSGLWLEVQ